MKSKLIYVEDKSTGLTGEAWIGRGFYSRTGQTVYFNGQVFQRVKGYKYNHIDIETGAAYWISGVKKDGSDRLYNERLKIVLDASVIDEYLLHIGKSELPKNKFSIEELDNIPAKEITQTIEHESVQDPDTSFRYKPENTLTDEQLKLAKIHYEETMNEVHKKARKMYKIAIGKIIEEAEKRGVILD
jgi:hypothetical protein